jgi:sugar lactone lactonase YvrE
MIYGKPVSSAKLLKQRPITISVYRGILCLYCYPEQMAFGEKLPSFKAQALPWPPSRRRMRALNDETIYANVALVSVASFCSEGVRDSNFFVGLNMNILVTSASGSNGDGYGALLSFRLDGTFIGSFSDDPRIVDPRGMSVSPDRQHLYVNSGSDRILALDTKGMVVGDTGPVPGLNPGGGNLGTDGRYYVGLRSTRTIAAFSPYLDGAAQTVLPANAVPYPRGFAFGPDGKLFLASGIGPDGEGANNIVVFDPDGGLHTSQFITDDAVSPLDLTIGPNGNVIVSSEFPFGKPDAVSTVREYDGSTGSLVRVFQVDRNISFHRPRGLRFDTDGYLFCVARDTVVAFDFVDGRCLGPIVDMPKLNGQAIAFFG